MRVHLVTIHSTVHVSKDVQKTVLMCLGCQGQGYSHPVSVLKGTRYAVNRKHGESLGHSTGGCRSGGREASITASLTADRQ